MSRDANPQQKADDFDKLWEESRSDSSPEPSLQERVDDYVQLRQEMNGGK